MCGFRSLKVLPWILPGACVTSWGGALREAQERVYALNKILDSVDLIGTRTDTLEAEFSVGEIDSLLLPSGYRWCAGLADCTSAEWQ